MRGFLAGARLQFAMVRSEYDVVLPFFTAPLFTIIFLTIVRHSGRHDLQPDALMAPVLMTMWWLALFQGGNFVTGDRWQGMLEWALATPVGIPTVILGRITAIMLFSLVGFFEVWGIGELVFGVGIPFHHPVELALTLLATVFAMSGTAVAFAALFVMSRNAISFMNSASFPFYVLGGVFVPVAVLPNWIQPLSSVIFMSWSADLLRASLKPDAIADFWGRLGMVALLGALSFGIGRALLALVLRRMRVTGELVTV